jgi:hypothetical protein
MNPYIMLAIAVLLLIGAIVRSIDWRAIALKWVGNNPQHAQIYIKAGGNVKTIQGERGHVSGVDQEYIYEGRDKDGKKQKAIVIIPVGYPYEYIRGRRIIGIMDGLLVPSPLGFMDQESLAKYREAEADISAFTESKTLVQLVRSIKSSKPVNWMMILIIIGVAVVGYLWYQNNQEKQDNPVVPAVTANNTLIQPSKPAGSDGIIVIPGERVIP